MSGLHGLDRRANALPAVAVELANTFLACVEFHRGVHRETLRGQVAPRLCARKARSPKVARNRVRRSDGSRFPRPGPSIHRGGTRSDRLPIRRDPSLICEPEPPLSGDLQQANASSAPIQPCPGWIQGACATSLIARAASALCGVKVHEVWRRRAGGSACPATAGTTAEPFHRIVDPRPAHSFAHSGFRLGLSETPSASMPNSSFFGLHSLAMGSDTRGVK